ncbi:MAG: hypothetical protein FDZ75_05025, partial [Actinobacteria bacterium]
MASPARIVVAYASIGSGHRIAAEAVAHEVAEQAGKAVEVELVDVLEAAAFGPSGERMSSMFRSGGLVFSDAAWTRNAWGRLALALGTPVLASALRAFERRIVAAPPAAVICTHSWPAVLTTRLVRRGRLRTKIVCVATDFAVHALWPRIGVSLFCVADAVSAEQVAARGIDAETVVTGIPVRAQFTLEYDRTAAREHFGLPSDSRIILVLAGASSPDRYTHLKPAFEVAMPALASMPETTVAVITGNDAAYADALRARASGFGTGNVHVLGYTERVAPLMAAADLGIAKPGGLVCAECVDSGLPLTLVGPTAGQERANARALVAAGVA